MSLSKVAPTLKYWKLIGVMLMVLAVGIWGLESSSIPLAYADETCVTSGSPSVASDKDDYGALDTAVLSGSGFDCGASLSVLITAPDGATRSGDGAGSAGPDSVTTDGNGVFNLSYALSGTDEVTSIGV